MKKCSKVQQPCQFFSLVIMIYYDSYTVYEQVGATFRLDMLTFQFVLWCVQCCRNISFFTGIQACTCAILFTYILLEFSAWVSIKTFKCNGHWLRPINLTGNKHGSLISLKYCFIYSEKECHLWKDFFQFCVNLVNYYKGDTLLVCPD